MEGEKQIEVSVVVPVHNEAENLPKLFLEIERALARVPHEVIVVDDASTDESWHVMKRGAEENPRFRLLRFQRNFGQTAAIAAGIAHAKGAVIVPMDADGENDPADIPKLLEKLEEGHDVVSGWRQGRWQGMPSRRIPSRIANALISWISRVPLHDYGCTLKVYRRGVLTGVDLYGEMHRFIPAYAAWHGARVAEVPVRFRPRTHGKSHYGLSRTFRVLLDLVLLKFLTNYMDRPIHFFGGMGFASLFLGFLSACAAIALKILGLRSFVSTPLPVLATLFLIVGIQLVAMGILAEMIMRTYYGSQGRTPYVVREKINLQ